MDIRNVAPTAVGDDATAYLAIELSGSNWLVGVRQPGRQAVSRHRLAPLDVVGRVGVVDGARASGAGRVVCVYEAGRDGFWLQRWLEEQGIECLVMEPASLPVDRRARRAKTDRLDVDALLRSLVGWLSGDAGACRMVRVPSREREDLRRTHRERQALIKERVRLVNRIKGLLASVGVAGFEPLRRAAGSALAELRGADGRRLPPALRRDVERCLQRVCLLKEQIAAVEAERDAAVCEPAAGDVEAVKIAQLMQVRSIGVQTATLLVREVFWRSFDNRRCLAGYVGLTGTPFNSGGRIREQGISKAGNPRARTAMIEAAWLWLRYQPDSKLSQWYRERVGTAAGRIRRITIVALARKLLIALWRFLQHGVIPEGAVLKSA